MFIYRVLNKDYCYNEALAYQLGGMISLPSNSTYVRGLNTFDYSIDKYMRHFFVFSEDAQKYLKTRKYPEDYCIGEFELDDNLAIKYSGLGVRYENISVASLEVALPTTLLKKVYLDEILSLDEQNKLIEHYLKDENIYLDDVFKIGGLDITGRLFQYKDNTIKETNRELYCLYQKKLWKEFLESYKAVCTNIGKYNAEIYSESEPNLEERAKVLKKYNLIK